MNEYTDSISTIRLARGSGERGKAACWMSALYGFTHERGWSDKLECVSPVINRLCIRINDGLSDARRSEVILPMLFDPLGTAGDEASEKRRHYHIIDAAIRRWVPLSLEGSAKRRKADASMLISLAAELRALSPIVDEQTRAAAGAYADAYADADAAAYADADADARDQFIIDHVIPVLKELIDMGPKAPIEPACSVPEFAVACGVRERT